MSLLSAHDLSITFGGVTAVGNLSFDVKAGDIHAVIGPNGAGKTTLFNLVTGVYTPSAGTIRFDGADVTAMKPHLLALRGMARTFQNLQIFMNMSAIENVMVGRHQHDNLNFLPTLLSLPSVRRAGEAVRAKAEELMQFVGLKAHIGSEASSMAYGDLKRLEIARALAAEPRLLLLDEPAAGLNPRETEDMAQLIKEIAARGVTILLVEHDMKLVMNVSDQILVLNYGRKLAEGNAAQIRRDPQVIAAYLGGAAAL